MHLPPRAALVIGLTLMATSASAEVHVTLADGRVSVSAKNATVSQILAEWAKVGQTRIVNGERVTGAPLTLELTGVPEAQALDIILRSAGGYLLAPRRVPSPNGSTYDRILIIPTSSPVRAVAAPPQTQAPPAFPQPRFGPLPNQSPDDEPEGTDRPAAGAARPTGAVPAGQPFNPFPSRPEMQPQAPPQAPPQMVPTSTPNVPVGVSTPGMPTPVPGAPPTAAPDRGR